MNRELKFRIWDRQQRKFHADADWGISLRGNHIIGFSSHDSWNDDRGYKINLSNQDNLIVQQYTGLKDKNGIPIYEGDIVKYARIKVESTEFAKGCFSSKAIEIGEEIGEILFIKPSFCLSFEHIRYDDINEMCVAEHRYEVIGNIFETPELLHIVNNDNNNQ